jgi:hypothetical protein
MYNNFPGMRHIFGFRMSYAFLEGTIHTIFNSRMYCSYVVNFKNFLNDFPEGCPAFRFLKAALKSTLSLVR